MRDRVRVLVVCSLWTAGVMVSTGVAQDDESAWRKIHEEHGVVVSTREQVGQALPSFRGQGTVPGSVLHVLTVVLDDARSKEWAKDAGEAQVLRVIDPRTQIVYTRSPQTCSRATRSGTTNATRGHATQVCASITSYSVPRSLHDSRTEVWTLRTAASPARAITRPFGSRSNDRAVRASCRTRGPLAKRAA